jgi:hypothetical protein
MNGVCGNNNGGLLGLQWIATGSFSTSGTTRCGTTTEDGASDNVHLLVWWWWLLVRRSNDETPIYDIGLVV